METDSPHLATYPLPFPSDNTTSLADITPRPQSFRETDTPEPEPSSPPHQFHLFNSSHSNNSLSISSVPSNGSMVSMSAGSAGGTGSGGAGAGAGPSGIPHLLFSSGSSGSIPTQSNSSGEINQFSGLHFSQPQQPQSMSFTSDYQYQNMNGSGSGSSYASGKGQFSKPTRASSYSSSETAPTSNQETRYLKPRSNTTSYSEDLDLNDDDHDIDMDGSSSSTSSLGQHATRAQAQAQASVPGQNLMSPPTPAPSPTPGRAHGTGWWSTGSGSGSGSGGMDDAGSSMSSEFGGGSSGKGKGKGREMDVGMNGGGMAGDAGEAMRTFLAGAGEYGFDPQSLLLSFPSLPPPLRLAFLNSLLPLLNTPELLMLSSHIGPRLKRDFLRDLPQELALHCLSFVDDPRTLARAACVSSHWRKLLEDEQTWKDMCERHRFQTHPTPNLPSHILTRSSVSGSSAFVPGGSSGIPDTEQVAIVSRAGSSAGGDQIVIPSSTNHLPPAFGITGPEMFVASRVRRDSGLMETNEEGAAPVHPGPFQMPMALPPPAPHLVPTGGVTSAAAQVALSAAQAGQVALTAAQAGAMMNLTSNGNAFAQFNNGGTNHPIVTNSNQHLMTGQINFQLPPLPSVVSPGAQALSASISANRIRGNSLFGGGRIVPEPMSRGRPRIMSSGSSNKLPKREAGFSYRMHFKKSYLTESNWLRGGRLLSSHTSSDDGVVTSLAVDSQHIIIGMANSKIHVFEAGKGTFLRTLSGHELGVWCLTLISAGGGPLPDDDGLSISSEDDDDMQAGPSREGSAFNIGSYEGQTANKSHKGRPVKGLRKRNRSGQIRKASIDAAMDGTPSFGPRATAAHVATDRFPILASVLENGGPIINAPPPPVSRARRMRQSDVCGAARGWGQKNSIVVSGGCDRDVRVWDLETGECLHTMHGHTSTIRCLKVIDGRPIAVSGSRDASLKVWDIEKGVLVHSLQGHLHSVRCIEIAGNQLVSGSYDCTCRIWDLDTGECLQTLRGHYHQIYAVAFDGERVATGSLDSTVRIWSAATGECVALLQGHTSLVGQLQLTGDTLITGGSDGRVIIFDLVNYTCLQRICAHDNSVTCLQFDDRFIVSGGNDGRVKLWDIRTGNFIRELSKPCEAVWRVTFRDDKCAILCKRAGKTILEVLSFVPDEV